MGPLECLFGDKTFSMPFLPAVCNSVLRYTPVITTSDTFDPYNISRHKSMTARTPQCYRFGSSIKAVKQLKF